MLVSFQSYDQSMWRFFFRGSATIYKTEIDEVKDLYMLQHFSL